MKLPISSLFLLSQFSRAALLTVPAWNGTYGVGTVALELTDTTRMDPFAPKPQHRSLMVSSYYPVGMRSDCDWSPHKYMPDRTAALISKGLSQDFGMKIDLGPVRLQMCHLKNPQEYDVNVSDFAKTNFPLVMFSPGDSSSRLFHGAQAQAIASLGYVVVTIDHPYDALVVEFPDGSLVADTARFPDTELQIKRTITRVRDYSFALDELSKPEIVKKLVPNRDTSVVLKTTHVPMYGHSAGGSGAGYAMQLGETRIAGALNMDGTTPAAQRPLTIDIKQPYMFMQAELQPEWPALWPRLNWAFWIKLAKSQHATFFDMPLLVHLMGLEPVSPEVAHSIGSLPGDRVMEIVTEYADAFFQFVLTGKVSELLKKDGNEGFTEVKIIRAKKT